MTNSWQDWMRDVCAFRYALGRRTYVAGMCADALAADWQSLHPKAQQLIARDLREEIERDDESRAEQSTYHPLGDDCDRQAWIRLMRVIEANEEGKNDAEV